MMLHGWYRTFTEGNNTRERKRERERGRGREGERRREGVASGVTVYILNARTMVSWLTPSKDTGQDRA